jgi:hypothetical protein
VDTKQLIASLVSSLAWPVAVVAIAVVFRRQVVQLLTAGPLKRLKAGPVEFEWDRLIAEAEAKVELAPREEQSAADNQRLEWRTTSDAESVTLTEEFGSLAKAAPSGAVLEAFGRVEQDLRARLEVAGRKPSAVGAVALARVAKEAGLITAQSAEAVEGAAILRNLAAHRPEEVTPAIALDYLALVDGVLFTLRSGGKNQPGI